MGRYGWIISILLAVVVVVGGCTPQAPPATAPAPPASTAPEVISPSPSMITTTDIEAILEQIYTQVSPSVVNIRVVQKQEVMFPTLPEIPGFPGFSFPFPQGPQEYYSKGLGSGFVWDKEGHIVTNNHVVAGADRISVTFHDGATVSGKMVGTDVDSDLAVIRVDMPQDELQPVELADSTRLRVGQLAVAIGNPYGLEGTMTVGFVSALGRLLPTDSESGSSNYSIPDVIQTDAPINPGNSGGVLVDRNGRLIGVTSAIISSSGANAGIGFAVPSAIVKKVVPSLIKNGRYEHPWLGISGISLNPELAEAMNLEPAQRGALVVDVVPGGPADEAGLRGSDRQVTIYGDEVRVGGDVITAIDGKPVTDFGDLVTYLARITEVGQTVTLTLLRQGQETDVKVTLAARPGQKEQPEPVEQQTGHAWLGILGLTLTPEIAEAMGVPSDQKGVLVEQVYSGSPADMAGLRGSYKPVTIEGQQILVGGDIIIAVEGKEVDGVEDLQRVLQEFEPEQRVSLGMLRDDEHIEIEITLGERPDSIP